MVYQATVKREDNNKSEKYRGLTARTFKDRLYEHTQDINNAKREWDKSHPLYLETEKAKYKT